MSCCSVLFSQEGVSEWVRSCRPTQCLSDTLTLCTRPIKSVYCQTGNTSLHLRRKLSFLGYVAKIATEPHKPRFIVRTQTERRYNPPSYVYWSNQHPCARYTQALQYPGTDGPRAHDKRSGVSLLGYGRMLLLEARTELKLLLRWVPEEYVENHTIQ